MLGLVIKALAIALIACSVASAQEAQKWEGIPKTKLEAFLGTTGTVLIRGRTEVGTVGAKGATRVLAVTLRNASTAEEVKGIVIEISQPSVGSNSAARSFVDYDEIAGLIQGIDQVVQVDRKAIELAQVEATYSTRDDVRVLVLFDKTGRQQAFVRVGTVGAKSTSLGMAELAEFKRLILLAKNHLDDPQAAAAERAAATARAKRDAAAERAAATARAERAAATERAAAAARASRAAAARAARDAAARTSTPAPRPTPEQAPPPASQPEADAGALPEARGVR